MSLKEFLERNRVSEADWKKAEISYEELLEIESDYKSKISNLNESAAFIARVLQKCDQVHSVRWRVKDSEHVLEKIIRKKASGIDKYNDISVDSYTDIITDLVGVRVLHLFKHEWEDIHDYIKKNWNLIEDAVAYIRKGDEGIVVESYISNKCKVEVHPAGYRSVHYIISTQPTLEKVISEIQVRTIFEEGWSEIDHKIRYPNFTDNSLVLFFLNIFNRMSGSADEMGTFVNNLAVDIDIKERQLILNQEEQESNLEKIEVLLQKLSMEESANKTKEDDLEKLRMEINTLKINTMQTQAMSLSQMDINKAHEMAVLSMKTFNGLDFKSISTANLNAANMSKALASSYLLNNDSDDDEI